MAEPIKESKTQSSRRLSINLPLFSLTDQRDSQKPTTPRSPKHFEEPNGVVGLGMVPLLKSSGSSRAVVLAISPRSSSASQSIPINGFSDNDYKMEENGMCEEYTCVISQVGANQIRKVEYFNGELLGNACNTTDPHMDSVMGGTAPFGTAHFLSSCFLCKKQLQGLDIFMYRGETAFCSIECRCKQMSMDELKENRGTGTVKPIEFSVSPCSGPTQFLAAVA
ncbi:unnamed protein product [Cuscuta epithymum]|uniref:FLZ-type domain-containing protein n=1 Tax=Cuscuta epithymum TaxID=186058 RepID=A0AAV0FZE0_9ASTE|nr:unnamed protein product [Cuscuta epithymum]